jgi:hypothetical protein
MYFEAVNNGQDSSLHTVYVRYWVCSVMINTSSIELQDAHQSSTQSSCISMFTEAFFDLREAPRRNSVAVYCKVLSPSYLKAYSSKTGLGHGFQWRNDRNMSLLDLSLCISNLSMYSPLG